MNNPIFKTIHSTLSPIALGEFIQETYQWTTPINCHLIRAGMNHLYEITQGTKKYVFRVYTVDWRTRNAIAEELRLLQHLNAHEVPVSFPIATHKGVFIHELHAAEGIRYGVLFSFAEGDKLPDFSETASTSIGISLAKMHAVTQEFSLQRTVYNTATLLTTAIKGTQQFFKHENPEVAFLEQLTSQLSKKFALVNTQQLRYGAVHLDVWFDNMHIDTDDKVTFFDFDFCGNGWLVLDVSYFLFQLFTTHPNNAKVYEAKAASFLKGYESVTPLSAAEKALLPYACLGVMLYYISVQCDRYDYWTNIFVNEHHLKRFVGSLQRWIQYQEIGSELGLDAC